VSVWWTGLPPIAALRTWMMLFVDYIATKSPFEHGRNLIAKDGGRI